MRRPTTNDMVDDIMYNYYTVIINYCLILGRDGRRCTGRLLRSNNVWAYLHSNEMKVDDIALKPSPTGVLTHQSESPPHRGANNFKLLPNATAVWPLWDLILLGRYLQNDRGACWMERSKNIKRGIYKTRSTTVWARLGQTEVRHKQQTVTVNDSTKLDCAFNDTALAHGQHNLPYTQIFAFLTYHVSGEINAL